MSDRARTRIAIVLLLISVVAVLPGGLAPYYLPKLAVAAIAIAAAAYAPGTGRLPRRMVLLIAVGAVVLLIAALASASPVASLIGRAPRYEGVLGLTVYAGLVWAGARLLGPAADAATRRFFTRGLAVVATLIAALYLVEATGARPIGGLPSDRTGSLLGNATDAGLVGVVLAVVLLGSLVVDRHSIVVVGILGALATVGLSASRAAVLAAAVAFIVGTAAVLARRGLRSRATVVGLAVIPIGVVLAVLLVPGALHRMTGGSAGNTVSIRLLGWGDTVKMLAHHWWLGVGPSGFVDGILPFQGREWAHGVGFDSVIDSPHDLVLQVLSAGGVVLLLVALAFAAVGVVAIVRMLRRAGDAGEYVRVATSAAAVVGVLVGLLTHFTTPSVLVLLLPLLGSTVADPIVVPARAKGAPVGRATRRSIAPRVWLLVATVLTVVLVAAAAAEVPLRVARDAALARDPDAATSALGVVRVLRPWDADAVSTVAQAAAAGADDTSGGEETAALAARLGAEAAGRLGGSAAPTLAAAVGLSTTDPKRAVPLFDGLIAESPFDAQLRVRRGVLLAQSGRLKEAVTDFERALAIDPANRQAKNDLRIVKAAIAGS